MKNCSTITIPLITLALLLGCSDPDSESGAGPASESGPETSVPTPSADASVPAARAEFRIPPENFDADIEQGQLGFAVHCRVCHGEDALGTDQGPPLIHRIYEPSHHSDLAFYRAIALGVHQHHWEFGDMPPVPGVSGEDAAHIIAWIRHQQRLAGIE